MINVGTKLLQNHYKEVLNNIENFENVFQKFCKCVNKITLLFTKEYIKKKLFENETLLDKHPSENHRLLDEIAAIFWNCTTVSFIE